MSRPAAIRCRACALGRVLPPKPARSASRVSNRIMPAGAQILVQLGIGRGRGLRLTGRDRPVEEGEERQFVAFDIDADRQHRLDRGALPQLVAQAQQARAAPSRRPAGRRSAHGPAPPPSSPRARSRRRAECPARAASCGTAWQQRQRQHRRSPARRPRNRPASQSAARTSSSSSDQRQPSGTCPFSACAVAPSSRSTGTPAGQSRGGKLGLRARSRSAPRAGRARHKAPAAARASGRSAMAPASASPSTPGNLARVRAAGHRHPAPPPAPRSGPPDPPPRARRAWSRPPAVPASARTAPTAAATTIPHSRSHGPAPPAPAPTALRVTSGRAIVQRGDGALGKFRVGLGQNLLAHRPHPAGGSSPKKGEPSGNGASAFGSPQLIAPPTVRPPSRRRTGISGSSSTRLTSLAASRGPAKRRRRPPLSSQSSVASCLGLRSARATSARIITSGLASSTSIRVPSIRSATGCQRLPQVVQWATEVAAPPGRRPRRISATLRRFRLSSVRLTAARAAHALKLEAGHPVAQFRRQVDGRLAVRASPGRSASVTRPSSRSIPAGSGPRADHLDRGRIARRHPAGANRRSCPLKPRRVQREDRARAFDHRHRALAPASAGQEHRAARMVQPVRQPDRVETARRAEASAQAARSGGAQACGCSPAARPAQASAVWKATPLRRIGQPDHAPRCAPPPRPPRPAPRSWSTRCGQSRASAQPPSTAISSGPVPGARSSGFRTGPAKPDDRRRHRQHPQQQQPPRGLVGLGFVILQAQQQRHARESAAGSAQAARRAAKATGSAARSAPSRSQGAAKPMGPRMNISARPASAT